MKFLNTIEINFFRSVAMLAVFGISMSIPIVIFNQLRLSANNAIIQQHMEGVKNWAMLYKIEKGDYAGFQDNVEIIKKKKEIKELGGNFDIYIESKGKAYCARTTFTGFARNKIYCVDSSGYSGTGGQICGNAKEPRCR